MATWHRTLDEIVTRELAHRSRGLDDDPALRDAVKRLADRWTAAYSEFVGAVQSPAERPSLPVEDPA